jgi:PAS domain S-box-containing protein
LGFDQWRRRVSPYAWSVVVIAGAALARALLSPLLGEHYPLGTFYGAVALVGWFWGVRPALLAAILGYLVGAHYFLVPRAPPFWVAAHALESTVYLALCAALIALLSGVHARQRRLDQALRDHARTRQALADSDARFKLYLDALPDIVYTWRADGSLEYVNPRWADYAGAERVTEEAVVAQLAPEDVGKLNELRQEALRRGEPLRVEFRLRDRLGHLRWFLTRCVPIRNANHSILGWVGTSTDVDDEKRATQALEHSEQRYRSVSEAFEDQLREANRRKDGFLATLAHELRNPLAPIRYATQLLKPGTPPEMAADARRMIDRQLEHMARLLDDLLDVSRITRGTLEIRRDTIDLRAAIRQAVDAARPLALAVEQDLRLDFADSPLPVRGDETRLIQVIGNLINNAIKFTPTGGKITVSAAIEGAMIVARVGDTGRGMSPQLLPHVFEMFVQGEPNSHTQTGLGIGLALAKQMVDLHGGRIEAHSEGPGRGSEFRVFLPRVGEIPALQDTLADAAKLSVLGADSIRVLIVDDNVDAADSLAHFLKLAGYQTRVAYDGRTAIEMAEILEPSVVLLDLGLPYLNGHEVARRLRTLPWGRFACLIALTGWGQQDDVMRCRESGFDEHFTKPVNPEVLLQRIMTLTRVQAQTVN